jgi:hypothetical protein
MSIKDQLGCSAINVHHLSLQKALATCSVFGSGRCTCATAAPGNVHHSISNGTTWFDRTKSHWLLRPTRHCTEKPGLHSPRAPGRSRQGRGLHQLPALRSPGHPPRMFSTAQLSRPTRTPAADHIEEKS